MGTTANCFSVAAGAKAVVTKAKLLGGRLAKVTGSTEESGSFRRRFWVKTIYGVFGEVNQTFSQFQWQAQSTGPCFLDTVRHVLLI